MVNLHVALTSIKAYGLPHLSGSTEMIQTILSIAFGIIGALALLVITISGLRYITSGGDPQQASKAKNGIVFALIGLLIAITAEAIVAFVVGKL